MFIFKAQQLECKIKWVAKMAWALSERGEEGYCVTAKDYYSHAECIADEQRASLGFNTVAQDISLFLVP